MQRFVHDEEGGVAILVALVMTALLGFGALALDFSHSSYVKVKLQSAADAAALAAVQALPDSAAATAAALDLAGKNVPGDYGTVMRSGDVVFGSFDPGSATFSAGASPQNAVQVTASRTSAAGNAAPLFLARALGRTSVDVRTRAIAYRGSTGPTSCVFVLDPNANSALNVGGSGDFSVPNCGVQVNSGHNKAANASNGSDVSAKSFCVSGGYQGNFSPAPTTGCAPVPDPLSAIPEPTLADLPSSACKTSADLSGGTWTPGRYCGYGGTVALPANVTLAPGLYYLDNLILTVSSGQNVTANGVTIYFDATSTLNHTSGGSLTMSASTAGKWKGIVMFQSRSAPINNMFRLTGNANFTLDGTVYLPRAQLSMTGSSTVTVNSKVGYVIANKLQYTARARSPSGPGAASRRSGRRLRRSS
jgi:hypothetical protein